MCGRYQLGLSLEDIKDIQDILDEVGARYVKDELSSFTQEKKDIYPGSRSPVITLEGLKTPLWGFPMDKKLVFNARRETIFEKPMFRRAVEESRCIVPASLFYEWRGKEKIKHRIRTESPLMFMGGILEKFPGKDGGIETHFSIITGESENEMVPIHDRTPIIIDRKDIRSFMDPDASKEKIKKILEGYKGKLLITKEDRDHQLSMF